MNWGFQNQFEKAYDQDQDYIHGEAHKQLETVLVLVWLLFNIPVNDFSVMLGAGYLPLLLRGGGRVAQWLGRRGSDQGVPGSNPVRCKLRCDIEQVTYTLLRTG